MVVYAFQKPLSTVKSAVASDPTWVDTLCE